MKCRACGMEIAEKAIVCYRCGTPTADLVARTSAPPVRRPAWIPIVMLVLALSAAVWIVERPAESAAVHWSEWAAVAVLAVLAVFRLRRSG